MFYRFRWCLIFILILFLFSCYTPKELIPPEVKNDLNKTVYVDYHVYFSRIPYRMKRWIFILRQKPLIGYKIQDYLKRTGWIVTNYHFRAKQVLRLIPYPADFHNRPLSYNDFIKLQKGWAERIMTEQDVNSFFKANYMLLFFYYPDSHNIRDYVIEIFFAKLKPVEERKKVLKKRKNIMRFHDFWNVFDKVRKVKKPLLFTIKKAENYIAASVVLFLQEQGFI